MEVGLQSLNTEPGVEYVNNDLGDAAGRNRIEVMRGDVNISMVTPDTSRVAGF